MMTVTAMKDNLVKKSGDLVNDLVNDTISRQAAIDELPHLLDYEGFRGEHGFVSKDLVRTMLKELHPAQPEQFNPCTVCQEFDCTGCKFRRTNE